MGAAGGGPIITIGADSAQVLQALDEIIAGVDEVTAAIDAMGGGASLGDVESELMAMGSAAGEAAGEMGTLADSEAAASDGAIGLGEAIGSLAEGIRGAIDSALGLAGLFLEFEAIQGVISAVTGFIGSMFGMNTEFQRLKITLANFVGDARAQQLTDWISNFGKMIPFTTEALAQA